MTDEIETIEAEAIQAEAPRRGRPPKAEAPAIPDGHKLCRVLKKGDGKVAKGFTKVEADGQTREQYYEKGDEIILPAEIADALEDRGLVET